METTMSTNPQYGLAPNNNVQSLYSQAIRNLVSTTPSFTSSNGLPVPMFTSAGGMPSSIQQTPYSTSAPDFMFLLKKILSDESCSIISWSNGFVCIHDPNELATSILPKYFRHSNFSSFQRQLNYFGFRKVSGKGKMVPCTYYNENTTDDLQSLLQVKKKPRNNIRKRSGNNNSTVKPDRKSTITKNMLAMDSSRTLSLPTQSVQNIKNTYELNTPLNIINGAKKDHSKGMPTSMPTPQTCGITNYPNNLICSDSIPITNSHGFAGSDNLNTSIAARNYNLTQSIVTYPPLIDNRNSMKSEPHCTVSNINGQARHSSSIVKYCNNTNLDPPMLERSNVENTPSVLLDSASDSISRPSSLTDLAVIPTLSSQQTTITSTSKLVLDKFNISEELHDDFPKCEPVDISDIMKAIIG